MKSILIAVIVTFLIVTPIGITGKEIDSKLQAKIDVVTERDLEYVELKDDSLVFYYTGDMGALQYTTFPLDHVIAIELTDNPKTRFVEVDSHSYRILLYREVECDPSIFSPFQDS